MKWFIPSWNGDLRLEPTADNRTELRIYQPTLDEVRIVNAIGEACVKEGWLPTWTTFQAPADTSWTQVMVINAPLERVGALAVPIMRPGPAVLTVVSFADRVETVSPAVPSDDTAYRGQLAAVAAEPDATAAVTVKRHTLSCPQCIPGAIQPATEALLAFLSPAQHLTWAKDRTLVVEGGLSGHTYLLAHRHSPVAQGIGRICYDLDAAAVVHFHDWTVPPEEEILAAKLILEHREDWLRNEATLFGRPDTLRFKNPFGGINDGRPDAGMMEGIGMILEAWR